MAQQPTYWVSVADDVMTAEAHYREWQDAKHSREQKRAQRARTPRKR